MISLRVSLKTLFFCKALKKVRALIKDQVTPEFNKFLSWAVRKIDWYDPLIEREDVIFEKVNRDSLGFLNPSGFKHPKEVGIMWG